MLWIYFSRADGRRRRSLWCCLLGSTSSLVCDMYVYTYTLTLYYDYDYDYDYDYVPTHDANQPAFARHQLCRCPTAGILFPIGRAWEKLSRWRVPLEKLSFDG